MQDKLQGNENTPSVTERRVCPRFRVNSLTYVDIGNVNGGIVTSLSENGLALTAASALGKGECGEGPLRMRVQLPGNSEVIEASGEIVWTSPSGKEVCVRFVEIRDEAREQIRTWISDQASSNELRPDPSKLSKMRLSDTRRKKPRPSRFTFSNVASSRVEPERETAIEDSREIAREPAAVPPGHLEGAAFCDGAEAVASAFESTAFAEDRVAEIRSRAHEHITQTTSAQNLQRQPSLSIPERRQHSRRQILVFTYAVLGEDNGGLVFNMSEGGLALTAAALLQEHHFNKMRVRFPDSEDWIEASGRVAWKSDSGKEVGIEFVGLREDARLKIKEWVLQEPAADLRSEESERRTSRNPLQELPSLIEPDGSSTEPLETPAPFEGQGLANRSFEEPRFENGARTPAASSYALFKTGIRESFERASIRRRVAKIKPPPLGENPAGLRTHVTLKALSIAAGVALAAGGWMYFQRTSLNEGSGIVAQSSPSTQSLQEATQKPSAAKTEAGHAEPTTDFPAHSNENAATEVGITKPSVQQIDSGSPAPDTSKAAASPSSNLDRAEKEKPQSVQKPTDVRPANLPRGLDQSQRALTARREQETKARQVTSSAPAPTSENKLIENRPGETKSAETKPAEGKPVEIAQALPTLNSSKDANMPLPSLNSNPPRPTAAPSAEIEKPKSPVVPKQPEAPVARTPVVTVSFDPYLSIRMPKAEKSKKSQQGKSLQMGRLLSRVDPVYPEEAKQQGIEGTVSVHAIFNREGTVQSAVSLGGPPLLTPAAVNAVRQWRYSQTILGGQAMETEEDVTVLFRLANSASKN